MLWRWGWCCLCYGSQGLDTYQSWVQPWDWAQLGPHYRPEMLFLPVSGRETKVVQGCMAGFCSQNRHFHRHKVELCDHLYQLYMIFIINPRLLKHQFELPASAASQGFTQRSIMQQKALIKASSAAAALVGAVHPLPRSGCKYSQR